MQGSKAGEGGGREGATPPSPSQRVQLEIDILVGDLAAPSSEHVPQTGDGQHVVLAVTADAGLARYIALCVGMRSDLELVTVNSLENVISHESPRQVHVVVADAAHAAIVQAMARVPALLIVDDPADVRELTESASSRRVAVLVRPFNTRTLLDRIDELLE